MAGFLVSLGVHSMLEIQQQKLIQEKLETLGHRVRDLSSFRQFLKKGRKKNREWKQLKQFPDFLELLGLSLSAGMSMEQSLRQVVTYLPKGELQKELIETGTRLSLGQPQEEVFRNLKHRLIHPRLSAIIVLIHQALRQGNPMQSFLFEEADNIRQLVMMNYEHRAQTASIRLLFPLLFIIFPTLFLILFGPLILKYVYEGSLF